MTSKVSNCIIKEIKNANYLSIIVHSTPNISSTDQLLGTQKVMVYQFNVLLVVY